ncbi:ATP-binding protein [Thalassotalea nanhaiensis]|uniref:ATP-binding protein n=1 Tax=Thalassotalea nanhaiensis TaxID=3065648 RepID=A0ABY9TFB4_9GAMM|nr:ATP-binding protein [Colwelliaceae bacterium SQ345]
MSGLKRIILIDTHLPGLVELNVDGHTNICGTNASGKTTLQRLIPVFYGESPNKVVPATRDNFQTWYLPRESSFIIYEYQRLDGAMCMAILTSSNTGVLYRFVAKEFVVEDFIGEDIAGRCSIAISEIIRNMRRENIIHTKALNTKEFRAVIQNDRPVMALSSNKRDLLTASRSFSLCESDARLRHIEKLIKAVHSKEGKMETIKAMIAAILEEDGVETPSNKISKAQVDDWIKECSLIKQFDELMPQYHKLQKVNAQLEQTETRLSQLKQQLSVDLSLLSDSIVTAEHNHQAYKSQLNELNSAFEQQRDELNRDISLSKAEVNSAEQHLDQIEDEFNAWQDKSIETHQGNLEKIPSWQSQLQSKTEQHALLTEEHQDIEAAYHKRLAEIEKKQSKELAQLNEQKDLARDDLREKQLSEQNALQLLHASQDERFSSIKGDFERQINDGTLNLQTVRVQIEASGPTVAEQDAMAIIDASVEQAQQEEDQVRGDLSKLQDDIQQLKYQQIASNEKLNKSRSNVATCIKRLTAIEVLLYPGENTLLEFLRKEHNGWEADLGKVINPELLMRTDLAPSLADIDNKLTSIYGVLLDIDAINDNETTQTETELKQQFDVAEQDLKAAKNVQTDCEVELDGLNKQVREKEQQHTTIHSQCQFKEQARKRVQDERTQLKSEQKQALTERKTKQQKSLQQLQKSLDKLVVNQQQAYDEHKEQCHDEKMEHELHWQQLVGDIEQKLSQIKSQIDDANEQHKAGLKACKKWYKDELASREVDVEQIASLKNDIAKLQYDITITNKHRDSVNEYVRWYELVFTKQKASYLASLSTAKNSNAQAMRLLTEKSSTHQQQRQQLQEQLQQLEKALSEQKELASGINSLKPQFALLQLPTTEPITEQATPSARLVEGRELFEQQRRATQDITSYVNYFDNAIGQKAGISLTETWEHARRDCLIDNAQGLQVLDSRKMVNELETLLTVLVPQHLEGVRNNGLNFGNDLTQYYNILADIDTRISSQSRRISKEVDQELFLDGVSESSVKIRSKISEFDFWPKLARFNKLHQAWLNDEESALPDEEYTQTIREVLEVLGKATITGGISQLLDIELHLKEGNSELVIRTDRQLNESSSHGMAYLILCKFLLAFTRLLRGHSKAVIHWPIDEIGTLANKNVKKIFDACKANQITVLGAFPNPESDVLHFFENRYLIDKSAAQQKLRMVQPKVNPITERLKQRQQADELEQVEEAL